MLEPWTGEVVGRMHIAGISHRELATACGFADNYLSYVLHGKKKGGKSRSRKGMTTKEIIFEALEQLEAQHREAELAQ